MYKILLISISLSFTISQLGFAGKKNKSNSTPKVEPQLLKYVIQAPEYINTKTPVVILLHGYGSNENDLFSLKDKIPKRFMVISLQAPKQLAAASYTWWDVHIEKGKRIANFVQHQQSIEHIVFTIDSLQKKYGFDKKGIYLCGFSQGAMLCYSIGMQYPYKLKGIAALSGRYLEQAKANMDATKVLLILKIFEAQGTEDTLMYTQGKETNEYLKRIALKPEYHEYKMGHAICAEEIADLVAWLEK
jgi:phospholipase/carboxylesterase